MSKKKIIIILVVLALGVGLFIFKSGGGKDLVSSEAVVVQDNSLANDFIKALMGVENVSLDTSLLNSSVFKSLVPSGAYVDPNPNKGKTDPFSEISGTQVVVNDGPENSPRNFGGLQEINATNVSPAGVQIKTSKITSTTATVSITGLPKGNKVTVALSGANNVSIPSVSLTYKEASSEYSAVVTGLVSKIKYTASLETPINYAGLQADFQTK